MYRSDIRGWIAAALTIIVVVIAYSLFQQRADPSLSSVAGRTSFELQQLVDRLELAIAASSTSSVLAFAVSLVAVLLPIAVAVWWLWRCERARLAEAELVRALHACGIGDATILELVQNSFRLDHSITAGRQLERVAMPPVWHEDDDDFDESYYEPPMNDHPQRARHHRNRNRRARRNHFANGR